MKLTYPHESVIKAVSPYLDKPPRVDIDLTDPTELPEIFVNGRGLRAVMTDLAERPTNALFNDTARALSVARMERDEARAVIATQRGQLNDATTEVHGLRQQLEERHPFPARWLSEAVGRLVKALAWAATPIPGALAIADKQAFDNLLAKVEVELSTAKHRKKVVEANSRQIQQLKDDVRALGAERQRLQTELTCATVSYKPSVTLQGGPAPVMPLNINIPRTYMAHHKEDNAATCAREAFNHAISMVKVLNPQACFKEQP